MHPADEQLRYLLLADLDLMQMATGVVDPTIADDTATLLASQEDNRRSVGVVRARM